MQFISFINCVASLMPEDTAAFGFTGPFDLKHLAAFEAHQPRIRQIKWNRKSNDAIGIEELFRKPRMRTGNNIFGFQFAV